LRDVDSRFSGRSGKKDRELRQKADQDFGPMLSGRSEEQDLKRKTLYGAMVLKGY